MVMVTSKMIKTYEELLKFKTFEERFNYLRLDGTVGKDTFGFDRFFNQIFYKSKDWLHIRDQIIIRDNGCDLGVEGYEIRGQRFVIHHLNPILLSDITERTDLLLNPDFLITTTHRTHNAIHYGDESILFKGPIERRKNDTCPWKR